MKRHDSQKGFTLIELIVVIAILGILAAILVPTIAGFIQTSRENTDITNAKMLYTSGVLSLASSAAFSSYVTVMPSPQGRTGTFLVYEVGEDVRVYIATNSTSGVPFDQVTTTWGASTSLPTSGLIGGTLPT